MGGRTTLARTWLEQAEADLCAAEDSTAAGHHEWSCFQAQQAGEKALKAFLYDRGRTSVLTHSLRRLVRECAKLDPAFAELDDAARLLDQYYIPTRYPNGLDEETAPAAYYDQKDADRCLSSARSILARVRPHFAS
jgi:HEPN domain-containing protein